MSRPGRDELPVLDDLASVVQLVRRRPGLYLRYSDGPASDREHPRSRDYEADVDLPGLSVTTIDPEPWWERPLEDWVARRICKYAELGEDADRFPWLLDGKQVGEGPDHEPVVELVEPVAAIGPRAQRPPTSLVVATTGASGGSSPRAKGRGHGSPGSAHASSMTAGARKLRPSDA